MTDTLADLAEHLASVLADVEDGRGSIACVSIVGDTVTLAAAGEQCADAMARLLASAQSLSVPEGVAIN